MNHLDVGLSPTRCTYNRRKMLVVGVNQIKVDVCLISLPIGKVQYKQGNCHTVLGRM